MWRRQRVDARDMLLAKGAGLSCGLLVGLFVFLVVVVWGPGLGGVAAED